MVPDRPGFTLHRETLRQLDAPDTQDAAPGHDGLVYPTTTVLTRFITCRCGV